MAKVSSRAPATNDSWQSVVVRGSRMCGWLVLLLLCASSSAWAQQYQADAVDEKLRSQGLSAQNLVKNPAGYSAEREQFLAFFNNYYFPAMTRFGASDLAEIGKMRYELFSKFLWATTNAEMQADLTKVAHEKSRAVILSRSKNYHPAVRYNAILILGMLDKQYPIDQGANRRPSIPLNDSNALLRQVVDAAANGKSVDAALLVGALVGLERHAQFRDGLERGVADSMTAALIKLLAVEPLVPQADRKVADWIRIQAAIVLAKLGSPGPNGEVLAALTKLMSSETEPKLSLDARCQIAGLLGTLNYQGATLKGQATADAVLKIVNEAVTAEAKEAKNFEQLHLAGYAVAPSLGRATLDPETRQPVYERRTLLARLSDVRRAVEVMKPIVPADQQAKFDAILVAMKPVIDAAANTNEIDLQLADKIGIMAGNIERAVNPNAAADATASAGEEF